MVTNTTYAALSMRDGDAFAKKFGGESGDDRDFFLLTIEGRDDEGDSVGSVEYYLADFRFDDNSRDYIVDQWTMVDVSSLAGATQLEFSLSSSDVGQFGMNTPAYFAVDHIVLSDAESEFVTATVTRSDADLSEPLVVTVGNGDPSELTVSEHVVIPSESAAAQFKIRAADDAIVDGTESAPITVSSETHTPSQVVITVEDDDIPTLTLSVRDTTVLESAGAAATQLIVHRNADIDAPLNVQLSASGNHVDLPASLTIPAGAASLEFDVATIDNVDVDGSRSVTFHASAENYASDDASVIIEDDDSAALTVMETEGATEVSESGGKDQIQVALAARPLSNVLVSIVYSSDDLILDVEELSFTPESWNQIQSVLISGLPDFEVEDDETVNFDGASQR